MKRSIVYSIVLVLSAPLLSLMTSVTASAQTTGEIIKLNFVTLGSKQLLRITAVNNGTEQTAKVRFGQQNYTQGVCNGAVCKHTMSSQSATPLVTLAPGETASFDIPPNTAFGVRGSVFRSRPNVKVSAFIVDTMTGEVVTYIGGSDDGSAI